MHAERVLVRANCWTCDADLWRSVARRNQRHGHLTWYCRSCEVGWTGPGEAVPVTDA